ncbi:MAG: tRNA guanosine(34) transglycosylase Tgt [Patescibacteria group bacterium]
MVDFGFKALYLDKKTKARSGVIVTPHGVIETPAFVPVGTQATVKSLTPDELEGLGVELFFVNTYHAYLRPGIGVIKKIGGLHKFMNWQKPLITDSGGFQVFSLGAKRFVNIAISESAVLDREKFTKKLSRHEAIKDHVYPDDYRPVGELVKIDEDGVTFTSHWDGSTHRFTPEFSMELQSDLGSDIHIAFDECPPYPTTHEYAKKSMERTHRWAKRSLTENSRLKVQNSKLGRLDQALYGVIQGSVYEDLRKESADFISSLEFDGIAIGGVAVGESKKEMRDVCEWVVPRLPDSKPRHLLGVGELDDIFDIIERGVDTFDCVQPPRLARMGRLLSSSNSIKFELDITNKAYAQDLGPIDDECACYACTNFTRAYIHHLFRVRELLAYRLATIHNIYFVIELVKLIRKSISNGTFLHFKEEFFTINKL